MFSDTFVKARAAVPKFLADSNYETEGDVIPQKRRRIRPNRLESSSEDEMPIRTNKAVIPAPPPIPGALKSKVARKGQGLTKEEFKKKERAEVMERLNAARAAAAAKMTSSPVIPRKSPWKVTPMKNPSGVSVV